jgi:4-aminobutyrate aminotransferase/(S)-3-amino-2-methylpropionate transaminase
MASLRAVARLRPIASRIITRAPVSIRSRAYASAAAAKVESSGEQPFFAQEADGPNIKTAIPGPKAKQAIAELDEVFDVRSLNMMANYEQSFGNYITDLDGNVLLDVYAYKSFSNFGRY